MTRLSWNGIVALAILAACLSPISRSVLAAEPDPAPLELARFTQVGTPSVWRRPAEVSAIIVTACGGGGGGKSVSFGRPNPVGELVAVSPRGPGQASLLQTVMVEVSASTYTITVGAGGTSGGVGGATTIVGEDLNLTFHGGAPLGSDIDIDAATTIGGFRTTLSFFGDGVPSVFGPGGTSATAAVDSSAEPAPTTSFCAGGGAGYNYPSGFGPGRSKPASAGGPGMASIFPLPDVQRLANLIGALDALTPAQ